MKKTLLIGSFGAGNIGDELILNATLEKYPNSIVMTANTKKSADFLEKEITPLPPFPTGIKSIFKYLKNKPKYKQLNKKIDQIVFAGGGLFSKKTKAVWIWTLHVAWCKYFFPDTPLIFEYQGVDRPLNLFTKTLLAWSFRQAKTISVRDKKSADFLETLPLNTLIKVGPDRVEEWLQTQVSPKPSSKQETILLNAAKKVAPKTLKKIQKKWPNAVIKTVCFDEHDAQNIPTGFSQETIIPKTKTQLFKLFKSANIFIGQRFHFLILSKHFSKQTFLLEKPYAPKTELYAKENQLKQI